MTTNGIVTLHQRYIYRGYLQIACCDLSRNNHPCIWHIIWDPNQPIAARPLAIRKDGTWYAYGWDLCNNICEIFGAAGYIRTMYTYSPLGTISINGDVSQPICWSSEFFDKETALTAYLTRFLCHKDGKWNSRDFIRENDALNVYLYLNNYVFDNDYNGLLSIKNLAREMAKRYEYSYEDGCNSHSIEFDAVSPVIVFLGIPLRFYAAGSGQKGRCCDKNKNQLVSYISLGITLEAYAQYGAIKKKSTKRKVQRKRRKRDTDIFYYKPNQHTPSMGYGEKETSVYIESDDDCPPESQDISISVFFRGSMGAGVDLYGSTSFTLYDDTLDEGNLKDRFNSQAGVAYGLYGASLELGINVRVCFRFADTLEGSR